MLDALTFQNVLIIILLLIKHTTTYNKICKAISYSGKAGTCYICCMHSILDGLTHVMSAALSSLLDRLTHVMDAASSQHRTVRPA